MKWIRTVDQTVPHIEGSVLTIGNFDGLHCGHRKLIDEVIKQGNFYNLPTVVLTFKPHPRSLLKPSQPVFRLFDYNDQAEIFQSMGIDYLVEEKFTKDFSLMSADEFLDLYIKRYFKPSHLVVGHDFSFGHNRGGDLNFIQEYCSKNNIGLSVVSAFEYEGKIVSSSSIRKLLEHGDLETAEKFLNRKYYIRGPVRVGFKRGRQIGVPTANVSPDIEFVPRKGVYFSHVTFQDPKDQNNKDLVFNSITNIGFNPTFENQDSYLKVETHIFDFNQEIYGEQIKVELLKFHRDEMKFQGIESLKVQIEKDLNQALIFFESLPKSKSKPVPL